MRTRILIFTTVAIMAAVLPFLALRPGNEKPLPTCDLGDGRVLQVEGVTYGTNHQIGRASMWLSRLQRWLPSSLVSRLMSKHRESHVDTSTPSLVVWVDAIDPVTGKNVDCQRIRVEIVGEHGDVFESQPHWHGFFGNPGFWRVGHLFRTYPRDQEKVTVQVVTWKNFKTNRFEVANPHVVKPDAWAGQPLPQKTEMDGTEVLLRELLKRTNGSGLKIKYAASPAVYWEPVFEMHRHAQLENGWEAPEWTAEDPLGNKGQHLGVHQPVLRFFATFFPSITNAADQLLATLPQFSSTNMQSIQSWQQKIAFGTNDIIALGVFPPGSYSFTNEILPSHIPPRRQMGGGVIGGAPTGWTSSSRWVTSLSMEHTFTHYSDTNSIIYLRVPGTSGNEKLALRLRDEHGNLWPAQLEPQGTRIGIFPFILTMPPDVGNVTPEVVLLKPIEAEFTVKTPVESN